MPINAQSIPFAAALRIFADVWGEYLSFREAEEPMQKEVLEFVMDVEFQLRHLLPVLSDFRLVHERLLNEPTCAQLRAVRAALGNAFLAYDIWPVKNYFSR